MEWGEFITLLSGLNEKTALGKIVSIRAEKDPKVLKSFTKEQKTIRKEWMNRKAKKAPASREEYDKAMKNFEAMFRAMAI